MTDGFNRQFARPVTRENNFINLDGRDLPPQLRLRTFKRFQTATYVATSFRLAGGFGESTLSWRGSIFASRNFSSVRTPRTIQRRRAVSRRTSGQRTREATETRGGRGAVSRLQRYPVGDRWPMPRKLIVATSNQPRSKGGRARDDKDTEDKTPQAFSFLDLTRPFLYLQGTRGGDRDQG
jgi:hypothetical protein